MAQLAVKAPRKAEQIRDRRSIVASTLFMGMGQVLFQKQYIKGFFFALIELAALLNASVFYQKIRGFITLGDAHPDLPIMKRDNSLFMMVEGIIYFILLLFVIGLYIANIHDAMKTQRQCQRTGAYPTNRQFVGSLADTSFAVVGLSPILVMLVFFIFIPLLFSALIAFTNYSTPNNIPPANMVDWVGMNTFREIANRPLWSGAFARTVLWTFLWAILATATSYAGGMLMALTLLNRKIKLPKMFRSIYVLPYSVPAMLSLMVWRNLLNGQFGPVNGLLKQWGIISQNIPWLSEIGMARFSCVLVNLWLGFPYFMMLITGVMTSVPSDLYEAAQIDGANKRQQFMKITLPLVLYQTIPLFIMSFSYNLNNFGAVYYLTQGGPTDTATTQSGAGGTDILMSWMYKLTYDLRQYNKAAVLAILLFLVVAPFAIYNFSRTKAFKDGDL